MWKLIALSIALAGSAGNAQAITTMDAPLPMHIGGRVLSDGHGYTYQWPGVYFEAQFTGAGVKLDFDDSANNFDILVDGKPYMVLQKPGKAMISIYLQEGSKHTVRLQKRSETQYATGTFKGFYPYYPQTTPLEFPARARQIEFIGDSLTVGYGNTSAFSQCTPEQIFETTDAQQGFGPLTAKHFDADYQINAFSGLGMVRNYDGREHPKYHMPMLYDRAIFDDPTPVNQPDWHPQVIVIGIGGNDFSTPVRPDEPWGNEANLRADYVKTYTAFVKTIRARNPDAFIILATPPDRQEGYTGGTDDVFAAIKATGDTKIDRVTLPELDKIGCNGHPSTRADARVADFYIQYLTDHPQVWQGK
ncbi:SGNH/GDSL hydrolase family protein [Asticcacaulis taihuensis]|uniref:SGNH/GDSL hydrolase family protein n=1 Tax=Asticcacaulis taihuensis TaxID=260084 RepID=UPI0026E9AE05|nr:SGNH/GDSL hydrolase family protein [Asticcacaulis taihuensis]